MLKKSTQIVFILLISKIILNASIVGSKHDLSVTNYYGAMGTTTEVCAFCHTPHNSNSDIKRALWNRKITDENAFTLYGGVHGIPNNPSFLCLSCHDGVSSQGDMSAVNATDTHNVINSPGSGHATNPLTPNCNACHFRDGNMFPNKVWRIGPDLTDDHPVSVSYENAKAVRPNEFEGTPLNGLKLFDGNVECSSCHDPHVVENPAFLRIANVNSDLCKSCHIK
ncbi:MAG: cytochrome c3 family protein [Sulfurimonadaceae bacterium]|jgi:predicted CXXCH cytochrome family protein|nr:cytochrome c3 family protein [Sulfurimonadaceae bacterium]